MNDLQINNDNNPDSQFNMTVNNSHVGIIIKRNFTPLQGNLMRKSIKEAEKLLNSLPYMIAQTMVQSITAQ